MSDINYIKIDGGILEGGGQILRNAVAYSCLLNKPIRITNIRAGRPKPGLSAQHLCGLELIRDISSGNLLNAHIKSTEISLTPKCRTAGKYTGDTKTAGSVCLMMQTALPCLMFSNGQSELVLKGGTNAEFAPQVDYMTMITAPITKKFGLNCSIDLVRRGFYPKGGGLVNVSVNPAKNINPVSILERGAITRITGLSFVAGVLPIKMAHNMADIAQNKLKSQHHVPIDIQRQKVDHTTAVGNGSGIIIVAETSTGCLLAGSSLGNRDKSAQNVGSDAADQLLNNLSHGGCVDDYLQDQLIIFMALASGTSHIRTGPITLHTETAIHVASVLTEAKFTIEKVGENTNIIHCDGIGLVNNNL